MSECGIPLSTDVAWLVNMPPTLEALQSYRRPPQSLPPEAPLGARTLPFEVNHVFASPHGAAPEQRRHDLCSSEYLADMPAQYLVRPEMDVTDHTCISQGEHCHACHLRRDCLDIFTTWMGALALYERPEREQLGVHPSRLYLEPHREPLPSQPFLRQLAYDYMHNLPLLMLLTARHELGYAVEKVTTWKRKADAAGLELRAELVGACLDAQDWERLAARMRSCITIVPTSIGSNLRDPELASLPPVPRNDAPDHIPVVMGDLSLLYAEVYVWAREVYFNAVNADRCRRCGRLLRYAGRGRPPEHCPECAKMVKREQDAQAAESKRRARKQAGQVAELRGLLKRTADPEVRRHFEEALAIMSQKSKK